MYASPRLIGSLCQQTLAARNRLFRGRGDANLQFKPRIRAGRYNSPSTGLMLDIQGGTLKIARWVGVIVDSEKNRDSAGIIRSVIALGRLIVRWGR